MPVDVWVLEYHSPRCGTCQELAPLFAELARKNSAKARFGAVNIDTEAGNARETPPAATTGHS